jgi:hypothetical protein
LIKGNRIPKLLTISFFIANIVFVVFALIKK